MTTFTEIKTFEENGFEVVVDYTDSQFDPTEDLDEEYANEIIEQLDNCEVSNLDLRVRVRLDRIQLSEVFLGGVIVEDINDDYTLELIQELITEALSEANKVAKDLLIQLHALELK